MKLGGILVTSEFSPQKSSFALTIGCGINILNTKPSACLQDFSTTPIKIESVLASILYEFEHLYNEMINQSTSFDCFAPFKQRYYNNWLHS
jgi:biotin--protein ligase